MRKRNVRIKKRSIQRARKGTPPWRIKEIAGWIFVIAAVFTVLSLISSGNEEPSYQNRASNANTPQSQTSVLTSTAAPNSVSLIAVGDVMLARYIELTMRKLNDYVYPFYTVAEFLKNADITFGNLDTPLFPGRNTPKDSFIFRADPASVRGLTFSGFDVVSLANNQMMNYQAPGLLHTLDALTQAGVKPVGAGPHVDAAHTPAVVVVKGKKIAFYAYTDPHILPQHDDRARYDRVGLAMMDVEVVKNDVRNARSYADIVVVSMHAGREYKKEPTQFQKDFAHAAIDAGASVVIGHHPHVVQPVEWYGNGVIFYSLGNFISDQFFSDDVRTGVAARIIFDGEKKPTVELFPVRLDSPQPRILEGEEREETLKKLGLES